MDEFRVIWTRTALDQRNSIFEYWNKRNKNRRFSIKLNLAIQERLKNLKSQPEIGKKSVVKGVRVISMRHYSIFYLIEDNSIYIISFWDNRQDPEKLLKLVKTD